MATRADSTGELLARSARTLRRIWADAAAPFDLSPHQVRALRWVAADPIRLGELAQRLHIVARSATDVIDGLEAAGLVERRADPSDRRAVIVAATPMGEELLDDVIAAREEASDEWLARLSASDRAELNRLLAVLADPVRP